MSGGQHVGRLSDSLTEDDVQAASRSSREALKRLTKPTNRNRGPRTDLGDGDQCPDGHGRMYADTKKQTQRCPHRDHDGYPKSSKGGERPPTRATWPLGHQSFAEAVRLYHAGTTKAAVEPSALPELVITLEV